MLRLEGFMEIQQLHQVQRAASEQQIPAHTVAPESVQNRRSISR
jgi:hypothetical protein